MGVLYHPLQFAESSSQNVLGSFSIRAEVVQQKFVSINPLVCESLCQVCKICRIVLWTHILYAIERTRGRIAALLISVLRLLSLLGICSSACWALRQTAWVKWRKQPLVLMPGNISRTELWMAASKSAKTLTGENWRSRSLILSAVDLTGN